MIDLIVEKYLTEAKFAEVGTTFITTKDVTLRSYRGNEAEVPKGTKGTITWLMSPNSDPKKKNIGSVSVKFDLKPKAKYAKLRPTVRELNTFTDLDFLDEYTGGKWKG